MSILDLFRTGPKLPRFLVNIYGKLPCHREYFQVSLDPAFGELKSLLVAGVERFDYHNVPRPFILPDRRFFVSFPENKSDMAGCIWDSDDGQRVFPFMMAVSLPKKIHQYEQKAFFACLETLWEYLERYFDDLRQQTSSSEVYRRVRNVEHEAPIPQIIASKSTTPPAPSRFREVDLPNNEEEERAVIDSISFQENPKFLLWPTRLNRDSTIRLRGFIGFKGIEDFDMEYLREDSKKWLSRSPTPNDDGTPEDFPSEMETDFTEMIQPPAPDDFSKKERTEP